MRTLPLILILLVTACSDPSQPHRNSEPYNPDVSLIKLIANPDAFDGRQVRVIGYLHMEFESYALWLHQEDFEHKLLMNQIRLDASSCSANLKIINDTYVLIDGTLRTFDRGTRRERTIITDVTSCQPWSRIDSELAPNNSFKPKPLRGSA